MEPMLPDVTAKNLHFASKGTKLSSETRMENPMINPPTFIDWRARQGEIPPGSVVVTSMSGAPLEQVLLDGRHVLTADEPVAAGDTGMPAPGPMNSCSWLSGPAPP
jgi:hypothetical protein